MAQEITNYIDNNNGLLSVKVMRTQAFDSPSSKYILSLESKESRNTMRSHLDKFAQLFGIKHHHEFAWESVTYEALLLVKSKLMDEGLAGRTINTLLTAVRKTSSFAFRDRSMSVEEYERIKLVKNVKIKSVRQMQELSKEQISSFLKSCDNGTFKGFRDAAIFVLCVGCGLRRGEVVKIKMKDINFETNQILIHGKGNKERLVWMESTVFKFISAYVNEVRPHAEAEDYLVVRFFKNDEPRTESFINNKGVEVSNRLAESSVNYVLKSRGISASISFKPHDLRGTYATKLLRKKVPIEKVQIILGHESINTTKTYDLTQQSEVEEVMLSNSVFENEENGILASSEKSEGY